MKRHFNFSVSNINSDFAELFGAMIGDGCLSKYYSNYDNRFKYCVLITGHTHDELYFRNTIRPIFKKLFGINGCIRFKKSDNVTRFETISKRIFDNFVKFGFPVGLKKSLFIPQEILQTNDYALSCVRGIFDTDGSIYFRYSKQYSGHTKRYDYKNIEFKMNSYEVINSIKNILCDNGITTTNIRKNKNSFVLKITNQKSVFKFREMVRPNNPYHIERFLNKR